MAKNRADTQPRSVAVVRLSALGDVAIAVPPLYDVCRAWPDVHFVMVTRPVPAGVFVATPDNLTVLPVDLTNDYRGAWGMVRLARYLKRQYGIEALADLHSVMRTWVMSVALRLMGVRTARIHKGRTDKRALTGGREHRPLLPTHERYRQVFRTLNLPAEPAFTSVWTADNAPQSPLVPAKRSGERWIAIAPFSQHDGKTYPFDRMKQVVALLTAMPHIRIFLFGGGEREKKLLKPLTTEFEHVISMAHIKHTFTDELVLLAHCDAMVSMDSANAHLAALVALPVITIWGATHPYCGFEAYGQTAERNVQLPLDCRPCSVYGQKPCRFGDYRCLSGITPEMIVQHIVNTIPSPQ